MVKDQLEVIASHQFGCNGVFSHGDRRVNYSAKNEGQCPAIINIYDNGSTDILCPEFGNNKDSEGCLHNGIKDIIHCPYKK